MIVEPKPAIRGELKNRFDCVVKGLRNRSNNFPPAALHGFNTRGLAHGEWMTTSRRNFLKTTAIVGAGVAMDRVSAFAEPIGKMDSGTSDVQARTEVTTSALEYTRGVGVYPGEPSADFSPTLIPDTANYRNLALLRPAYHSSSYDYNLTAQLVTDGIKADSLPEWIVVSDPSLGPISKENREVIVDHAPMNTMELRGARAQVDIQLAGGERSAGD